MGLATSSFLVKPHIHSGRRAGRQQLSKGLRLRPSEAILPRYQQATCHGCTDSYAKQNHPALLCMYSRSCPHGVYSDVFNAAIRSNPPGSRWKAPV